MRQSNGQTVTEKSISLVTHTHTHTHTCPRTTIYVSSSYYICVLILLCVSSYSSVCPHTPLCVLILHRHTPACDLVFHVSAYSYDCALILLCVSSILVHTCPHTPIYVTECTTYMSSYIYVDTSLLILLYIRSFRPLRGHLCRLTFSRLKLYIRGPTLRCI